MFVSQLVTVESSYALSDMMGYSNIRHRGKRDPGLEVGGVGVCC